MFKNKNRRLSAALYCLLIGLGIVVVVYQYSSKISVLSEKKELRRSASKTLVYGQINAISKVQKSSRKWISYDFTYKDKYYHRKMMDVFSYKCEFDFRDKTFPIIIDSLHPETNYILFHKRDYRYFGYKVPASMQWVFDCVEPLGIYWLTPAPISPDN